MKKTLSMEFCVLLISMALFFSSCEYQPYTQGERLYLQQCANCHMEDGSGLEQLIPALSDSEFLQKEGAEVACLIRLGMQDTLRWAGRVFYGDMPPHPRLNATEITNILNYTRNAWGKRAEPIKVQDVEEVLRRCKQ